MSMPGVQMPHWAPPLEERLLQRVEARPGRAARGPRLSRRSRRRPGRPAPGSCRRRRRAARSRRRTRPRRSPPWCRSARGPRAARRAGAACPAVDLDRLAVDREAVGSCGAQSRGRDAQRADRRLGAGASADGRGGAPPTTRRSGATATPRSPPGSAPGVAGRSWIQTPVASCDRRDDGRRPTSIGSSPTPLAPWGAPANGASTRIVVIRGASSDGRDDVRRQPVVEVAAVAQLDLLDRGVADGLQRAALDLALGEDRVDDPADVVGGDDVADVDLACVEVDVDRAPRTPPSRTPGRRRRGRSRRRSRRRDTARTAGRCGRAPCVARVVAARIRERPAGRRLDLRAQPRPP